VGFFLPTAHKESKVHGFAGVACPLRSALRVWSPSRRLSPFESLPVLFHTGGAHGIHPSERSPLARYPIVSDQEDPPTVPPGDRPAAKRAGTPDAGLWGRPLRESLVCRRVVSAPHTGCSLGFDPSRVHTRTPCTGCRPAPLTCLANDCPHGLVRMHLRVSIGARLASPEEGDKHPPGGATLLGFSHRCAPEHSNSLASGLWIPRTPRRTLLPTDRRP
jgi:hypothetical protein